MLLTDMKVLCKDWKCVVKTKEKLLGMGYKWATDFNLLTPVPRGLAIHCKDGNMSYGERLSSEESEAYPMYMLDEKTDEIVKLTTNMEEEIMSEDKVEDVKGFVPRAEPPLVAMKIMTNNQIYCEKVQKKLFELGYWWRVGGSRTIQHWGCYGLEVDAWGDITFEQFKYDFDRLETVEYVLDEATDTFVVKDNIKPDAIGLDYLFNRIVLLQKETDALSEQKEQIANKISANTQAINILKDRMLEKVGRVGLMFAEVDEAVGAGQVVSPNTVTYYDLKVGDIVKIYDDIREVVEVESSEYGIKVNDHYMRGESQLCWFDSTDDWNFVSRPNK